MYYREMLPATGSSSDANILNYYGHYYASTNGGGIPSVNVYIGLPKYIKFIWSKTNSKSAWQNSPIYINYNPATMETITDGVYFSTDGGNTWSKNTSLKFIISSTTSNWNFKLNSTLSSTAFYVNFVYTIEE